MTKSAGGVARTVTFAVLGVFLAFVTVAQSAQRLDPVAPTLERADTPSPQCHAPTPPSQPARPWIPVERPPYAVVDPQLADRQIQALAATVKLHGYRCDSIHTARRAFFTTRAAFKVRCNEARYEYTIRARNGRIAVTVDVEPKRR